MRRRVTALVLGTALAGGLGACGSDEEAFHDVVPKTTPELRAPADASLPSASGGDSTSTTGTTETTTTETTPGGTSGGTSSGQAAPQTTTPQAAPQTGGTGTGGTGGTATPEDQQGGADAGEDSGGFSDFCQQNPGACPGQ